MDEENVYVGDNPGQSKKAEAQHLCANESSDTNELKTTNFETLVHLVKGMMGTGILAMPTAFKHAGIVFGTVALAFLAIICTHCMHMLLQTSRLLCDRLHCRNLSYQDAAEFIFRTGSPRMEAIAPWSKGVIKLFLCITQLGFCIVYFIFVADNIKQVVETYSPHTIIPTTAYLAMILPFVIVYSFVRSLKRLAPASITATFLQLVGLIIIFQLILRNLPNINTRPFITSYQSWPLYFGLAMFAFEGIGVVLPVENKMKTPEAFGGWNGVLNTGMVLLACSYISVGFYGFLKYGNDVHPSITLDLPSTTLYLVVRLGFSLALFLSIGLQYYVAHDIMFSIIKKKINFGRWENMADYAFRAFMIIMIFTAAEVIPHLDVAIALVGAMGSSTLALIFPPIMQTIVLWPDGLGKFKWRLVKNIAISLLGFVGFIAGSYSAIYNAIHPP